MLGTAATKNTKTAWIFLALCRLWPDGTVTAFLSHTRKVFCSFEIKMMIKLILLGQGGQLTKKEKAEEQKAA